MALTRLCGLSVKSNLRKKFLVSELRIFNQSLLFWLNSKYNTCKSWLENTEMSD